MTNRLTDRPIDRGRFCFAEIVFEFFVRLFSCFCFVLLDLSAVLVG